MTSTQNDYEDLEPTIGYRLRVARERRSGLDQGEFAEQIGVSRGTVSNYERDRLPGGPRQRLVLNAWAAACDVSRMWLETGVAEPVSPTPGPGSSTTHDEALQQLAARKRARSGVSGIAGHTRRYKTAA